MAEAHYHARLVWSGGALGPTKSVESYSREFKAEFDGKPSFRGSADPAFRGDPALYNPEDLLLSALSACHMLSYLAVCSHAGIAVLSYEDEVVGTVTRRDDRVRFVDVLLRPKVVLEQGSNIEKARSLHDRAHDICVIANSVNFPVLYEASVHSPARTWVICSTTGSFGILLPLESAHSITSRQRRESRHSG